MKIIKDHRLSILNRAFGWREEQHLSVAVLAGFPFEEKDSLVDEADLWTKALEALPRGQVLDLCMPKPDGEVMILGKAFAPPEKEVMGVSAYFRAGPIEKRVEVFGDRYFTKGLKDLLIHPRPYTSMDITWQNAFGGPGYARNPDGKGLETMVNEKGQPVIPLPNVEDPAHLVASLDDRPRPAGFGPQGLDWPPRTKGLGTFDRKWLQNQWPALPDDFDFSYYQLAPRDQRIKGFFSGGEFCQVRGMHPEKHEMIFHLPTLRCRLFLDRKTQEQNEFKEISAQLDTLFLIPHLELGILIWHGTARIQDDEAEDVEHLAAFFETVDQEPRPPEFYYQKIFAPEEEEAEPEEPEFEAPEISEPEQEPEAPAEISESAIEASAMIDRLKAVEAQTKAFLKNMGMDLDQEPLAPEEKAALAAIPPPADELNPAQGLAQLSSSLGDAQKSLLDKLKDLGLDMDAQPPEPLDAEPPTSGGPTFGPAAILKSLGITDPEILGMSQELSSGLEVLKSLSARLAAAAQAKDNIPPEPEAEPTAPPGPWTREQVLSAFAAGKSFAGADLTGLDLSDCRLPRIDLNGALLEGVDFSRTDLSRARLAGAILTEANLTGANLIDVQMPEAEAVKAVFTGADLSRANLARADFTEAVLTLAQLSEADLSGGVFERALLTEADCREIKALQTGFESADFRGADLLKADLTGADMTGSLLDKAVFSHARARGLKLYKARGLSVNFEGADLKGSQAGEQTSLTQSWFVRANLAGASWEDADLSDSNFSRAVLNKAEMNKCRFAGANLFAVEAKRADLSKSDFTNAQMPALNLMGGSLRKARLTNADLRGANLHGVDLYKSVWGETKIDEANLDRTLLNLGKDAL